MSDVQGPQASRSIKTGKKAPILSGLQGTVFVVSTGRTGTQAISRIFTNGFDSVTAVHEPRPSRRLRIASCSFLNGRRNQEQMVRTLIRARKHLDQQIDTDFYVESNPYLFGFLDVLDQVFDSPKVVHIVRDPRTMVRSALNFGSQSGLKRLLSAFLTDWMIKPELVEPSVDKTWSKMQPIERYAWFWKTINEHLDRGAELFAERYYRVRFEDLFETSGTSFRGLGNWIGLRERGDHIPELVSSRMNASRRSEIPAWDNWTKEDQAIVAKYCGYLAQNYGYTPFSTLREPGTSV